MNLLNKIKWIAGILLVFVIVLTTSLIDQGNFDRLRNSVITIYEDRIVANDLIFEMSLLIHKKEIAIAVSDSSFFQQKNGEVNREMQDLLRRYERTKLTSEEQKLFNDLKRNLNRLMSSESEFVSSGLKVNDNMVNSLDKIVNGLYELSKVQLNEGKRQMIASNEAVEAIDIFTQIEIIFLIIMAILILTIILRKPNS